MMTLLINKLHKTESISNILKKRKTLFDNPETYLKLPSETNFQFVIGKKLRGPRYNSDNELIPYSIVGQIVKKEKKFCPKKKTNLFHSMIKTSRDFKKTLSKSKINISDLSNPIY